MTHLDPMGAVHLVHADALCFIKTLPDNSVDLIATDPPYFGIKKAAWDNQWESETAFLAWLDEMIAEFWRVLKPTGSLYLFCGNTLAADTEILVRTRLNVLNHIVWAKPSGSWGKHKKDRFRKFFPATERIIFAEHYGGTSKDPASTGYAARCEAARRATFRPLIDYFIQARDALGVKASEINQATGTQMCSHWFSESQWQLPKREQYQALQALFARKAQAQGAAGNLTADYDALSQDYEQLKAQYATSRVEYEHERRTFSVTKLVPFTDVWTFAPVRRYAGKHPCEKPADMMEHIISVSSRPGDVVADFFMGSGATVKAALKLGRRALGVELEQATFDSTAAAIASL
ncbi:site-specific DNA-methyltransferase [Nissabacter sp. SGAir0207]|uniref:DNA-methyltransferase n=1 Tax=Nissabacter sp. SGAir0207 TaxID=2126321 RepID=UPI0010CD3E87|nr:site-specific DNA-methyltransferase [Nissabacter sp. SGAir0207]QCR38970.1 DNA adenine methylase [Nissabacter sp. SGAir0207]